MKKSAQTKTLILEQLRKTPIIQMVCEKMGISRWTFYRWKAEDPAFAKEVEESLLQGYLLINDMAESQLITALKNGHFPATMAWLKHHHPSYKNKLELEGSVSTVQELSPEQKELVQKALALADLKLENYES